MDISATTTPRSDQQNYDDYAHGPRTVTISDVKAGIDEQPVELHLVEYPGRPYKPSKSMRRALVHCWGKESSVYIGRRMTLVGDPTVKFGGATVGGIKIDALSNLDKPLTIALTVTRGKRANHTVKPLADAPTPTPAQPHARIVAAFHDLGVTVAQLEHKLERDRSDWDTDDAATLTTLGKAIKAGDTTVADEFPAGGES